MLGVNYLQTLAIRRAQFLVSLDTIHKTRARVLEIVPFSFDHKKLEFEALQLRFQRDILSTPQKRKEKKMPYSIWGGCEYPLPGLVGTSEVAEEDEAPDAGGATDEQAGSQQRPLGHLLAQPADKDEARDDFQPTQAVHHTVAQLAKAKVALRQRSHHGLERHKDKVTSEGRPRESQSGRV